MLDFTDNFYVNDNEINLNNLGKKIHNLINPLILKFIFKRLIKN